MLGVQLKVCQQLDHDRMTYRTACNNSDPRTVPGEDKFCDGLKPDICTYTKDLRPSGKNKNIPDFTIADRVDEFKNSMKHDPFDDTLMHDSRNPEFPFEMQTSAGRKTRGQICAYASAVFQLQFRFFTFSILHMKTHARLIRWDRAGAVVSEAFQVKDGSHDCLAEFIWRYSHMNRAQRGFDDSVSLATNHYIDKEDIDFEEIRETLVREEEKKAPLTNGMHSDRKLCILRVRYRGPNDQGAPIYPHVHEKQGLVSFVADGAAKLREADAKLSDANAKTDGHAKKKGKGKSDSNYTPNAYYLLSPRFVFDRSPFSKGTRSFVVYVADIKRCFHLKDSYRVPSSQYTPEHEVLEDLRKHKVLRIPTVFHAWDVAPYGDSYDTIFDTVFAQICDEHKSKIGKLAGSAQRVLRPYRLITREVAQELPAFKNWREVSVVMRDTLGGTSIV